MSENVSFLDDAKRRLKIEQAVRGFFHVMETEELEMQEGLIAWNMFGFTIFQDMYPDADHDGRGENGAVRVRTCAGAIGFSPVDGDCDDTDPEVFLGQFEICDTKDNNCDGNIDEVQSRPPGTRTWMATATGTRRRLPSSLATRCPAESFHRTTATIPTLK